MEDLLATQKLLHESIETLLRNFKKDGRERKTPELIKRKLETLNLYWQDFHSTHLQLLDIGDHSHTYFTNEFYEQTKLLYSNTRKHFESYSAEVEYAKLSRPTTPIIKQATLQPSTSAITPSTASLGEGEQKSQGSSSKLDEMLRKQLSHFKAFARTLSGIDTDLITSKWEYEDALKSIETRWSAIDSLHWDLDSQFDGTNEDYESMFCKYEREYQSIKKQLNTSMWSMKHREKFTPPMDLQTFGGSYHQWVSFKDLFIETIHNNGSLSNAQKMQFLKSKVNGEAGKLIMHLTISSQNYEICWNILNNRYNNKKLIFTSHVNLLTNLPIMQQASAVQLKKIHDTTNECLYAIQNLGVNTSTWDPLLVHILSHKLDIETHNEYIQSLKSPRELPTLHDFLSFLEAKFTALEASRRKVENIKPTQQQQFTSKQHNNYQYQKSTLSTQNKALHSNTTKCPFCKNDHRLFQCKQFQELSAEAKRSTITKFDICKNCLYPHYGNPCRSDKRCRECNSNHNTMLHDVYSRTSKLTPQLQSTTSNATSTGTGSAPRVYNGHISSSAQNNSTETLLATAQIRVKKSNGSYEVLRALIDPGSQTSLITENATQQLGLPRRYCKGVITGVGTKENNCKGIISIAFASMYDDYQYQTEAFIMKSLVNNLPNQSFEKPSWAHLDNLQLADPTFYISGKVDLLLGADVYADIIKSGIIKIENHPVIQETQLGWILCGNIKKGLQCNVVITNIDDIKQFWEMEDINQEQSLSVEDYQCVQYYQATTTRKEDGHYEVRLPLKTEQLSEKLGESKNIAIAQFRQLERKFIRRPDIALDYKSFINEYKKLGHMIKSSDNPTLHCYLPHHAVHRTDSTTTPLRVVFNPSMNTTSGYSLNQLTYRGPNLQKDLLELILKWRQFEFAFTADIEKMFRQIWLHSDDQAFHKIIWRDDVTQRLQDHQLTTVTYGSKSSPFLAMMTLKQLAKDEGHKFKNIRAAMVLEEDFYMDDLLSGDHTMESAIQLKNDLINLLKSGGFNLRKWASNKPELLDNLDNDQCSQEIFQFRQQDSTKTLGLRWHPQEDHFTFELKQDESSPKLTKRVLLSQISKIFDPMGWLSPVTTTLKLLFQQVWASNIQWDDEVSTEINNEWTKIKNELPNINSVKVPRWIKTNKNDVLELHGFSDSTMRTYSCILYCKINKPNQQSTVVMVAGKTKIVPEKRNVSLPRLELCGALLLSKLLIKVKQSLSNHNIKLFGWTDSTAVLGWLNGDTDKWKPFVANRVKQIVDVIPADCWRYVKSADNPADPASRGLTASKLVQHQLWWNGPTWLPSFDPQKSIEPSKYTTNMEMKKQTNVSTASYQGNIGQNILINELLNKYSNMTRVVRVLAWVLRMTRHSDVKLPYLTLHELNAAHNKIIKCVQETHFIEEIANLRENKPLHHKSKILNLSPFLDKEGLLRVSGRLKNANLSDNRKHPLILPNDSIITPLIINQAHHQTFHGGARLTTQDGRVRVVSVRTKGGIIKRPIVKLSILPVQQNTSTESEPQNEQPSVETKQSVKKGNQRSGILSTLLSIFLILNMLTSVLGSYNFTALNNEKALYFDKIANMQIIRDDWKIIVYYDMAPYWEGRMALDKYLKNTIRSCDNAEDNMKLYCNIISTQLTLGFSELKYYDQMLLNQQFSAYYRRRTPRGLINGVGYIAHSLFGVLDEEFAEQYKRDIALVNDNQRHIALLWKNQTSIVEAEYNLLKRTEESMNKQNIMISQHLKNVENATNILNSVLHSQAKTDEFILSAMITSNMLSKLNSIQETLQDIITNIYNAKFNIHLLTPEQLQTELNIISGQLPRDLSLPIINIQTDLKNIYHLLRVRTRMTKAQLIFEVRVPLVSRERFEIYHLIPIPRHINKNVISISPVSDILAINLRKDTFVPILDIKSCVNSDLHTYLCHVQGPIYNIESDSSLCIKDQKTENCVKTTSTCTNKWRELEVPNTYLYFCCEYCTLRIICEDQISAEKIVGAGIISLSENCLIRGDDFTIYSHQQTSSILNIQPKIYTHEIAPINNIINVTVSILPGDPENTTDGQYHLQIIKQQIEQMKQETAQLDHISYHDVHHYTAIYVVMGIAVFIGAAWAWRRVGRVRAARLEQPAPPAAAAAAARQPRSVVFSAPSASAVYSEVARPTFKPNSSEFEMCVVSDRQDKASSPILHSVVFPRD